MASNSGAARTSHRHKIAFGQFLAVVSWLLVIFATSASGAALEKTVGSVNPNNPQLLKPERHLDEEEPEEIDSATSNLEDEAEADGDEEITEVIDEIDDDETNQESGIENNPCDLCQGMTILNDVGVGHHLVTSDDRWNCADANLFFQNPDFDPNFFSDTPLETIDIPNPYPCRALPAFNTAFEKCCQPTIPFYDCEANVAESLFGDGGSYGMIQRAIPPIVSGDQKVNVTVWLVYQALEDIDEEAGAYRETFNEYHVSLHFKVSRLKMLETHSFFRFDRNASGTATIFVTLILRWNDPRLKWDINDEKCTNVIDVWTSHTVSRYFKVFHHYCDCFPASLCKRPCSFSSPPETLRSGPPISISSTTSMGCKKIQMSRRSFIRTEPSFFPKAVASRPFARLGALGGSLLTRLGANSLSGPFHKPGPIPTFSATFPSRPISPGRAAFVRRTTNGTWLPSSPSRGRTTMALCTSISIFYGQNSTTSATFSPRPLF